MGKKCNGQKIYIILWRPQRCETFVEEFLFAGNLKELIQKRCDIYDDEEATQALKFPTLENLEFEPIVTINKDKEKLTISKNINCDDFSKYVLNCTIEAAIMYNSSRKAPPMPAKMSDWCRAIRHLTNCAIDWNSECKDVTENIFNEESIKGHMHVLENVCDDDSFLTRYDDLPQCIDRAAEAWEVCYNIFKKTVEEQKNTTQEWTHYETHFYLCCARTRFRRCTLDAVIDQPQSKCIPEEAVTLQKFSVIVSEGDVFQDCVHNMMYPNCPGGDPRPTNRVLEKLAVVDPTPTMVTSATFTPKNQWVVYVTSLFLICL